MLKTAKEKSALYERQARVLERIAKQYPEDSVEVTALKQAAFALCFASSCFKAAKMSMNPPANLPQST
jgi:hypothetical protein